MSSDPDIRLARPDEAPSVHDLVQRAYAHYIARIDRRPRPMDDDYAALIAAGCVNVLELDGVIAGIAVLKDDDGALLLDNLSVAPSRHKSRLGSRLMRFAEETARARGYSVLRLFTHVLMVENRAIYAHLGFAEVELVDQGGLNRVRMEKPV